MAEDPLDLLQSMFPAIDGDVIAIVHSESDKDVDATVEKLLQLNESISPSHKEFPSLTTASPLQYAAAARNTQQQMAKSPALRQQPLPQHQPRSQGKWVQRKHFQKQQQQQTLVSLKRSTPKSNLNQGAQKEEFHQMPSMYFPRPVLSSTSTPGHQSVSGSIGSMHTGLNKPYYQPFYLHPGTTIGTGGYVYGGVGVRDQDSLLYKSWMAPPPPIAIPPSCTAESYATSDLQQPSSIMYLPPTTRKQQEQVSNSSSVVVPLRRIEESAHDERSAQLASGNSLVHGTVSTKGVISSKLHVPPGRTQSEPNFSRSSHQENEPSTKARHCKGSKTISITEGTTSKKLIILRGLPGSGKTTLARNLVGDSGVICSTDDFFYMDGQYVFDPSKLTEFHEKNRKKAKEAMELGKSPVIIDNTNTNAWEMKPYIHLALTTGYGVDILEADTPWRFKSAELARKNIHGVSKQKIERMLEKYDHQVSMESILNSHSPHEKPPTTTDHEKTKSRPSLRESQGVDSKHSEYSHRREHSRLKGGSNSRADQKKLNPTSATHCSGSVKDNSSSHSNSKPTSKRSHGIEVDNIEPQKRKSIDDSNRPNNESNHRPQQQVGTKKKGKMKSPLPKFNEKRPSSPYRSSSGNKKENEEVNNEKLRGVKSQADLEKNAHDMEKSDLCDAHWDSSEELELFDTVEECNTIQLGIPSQFELSGHVESVKKFSNEGQASLPSTDQGVNHSVTSHSLCYKPTTAEQHSWERTQSAHVLHSITPTSTCMYDVNDNGVLAVDAVRRTHSAQAFQDLKPVAEEGHNVLDSTGSVCSSVWGIGGGILSSEEHPRLELKTVNTTSLWSSHVNAQPSWPALTSDNKASNSLSNELTPVSVQHEEPPYAACTSKQNKTEELEEQNSSVDIHSASLHVHGPTQNDKALDYVPRTWNHSMQVPQSSSGHLFSNSVWANSSGIFGNNSFSFLPPTKSQPVNDYVLQSPPGLTTYEHNEHPQAHNGLSMHVEGHKQDQGLPNLKGNTLDSAVQCTQSIHSLEEAMQDESNNPLEHQSELCKELAKSFASVSHTNGGLQNLCQEFDSPFPADEEYSTQEIACRGRYQRTSHDVYAVENSSISSLTDGLLQTLSSEMSDRYQALAKSSADGNLLAVIQSSLKSLVTHNEISSAATKPPVDSHGLPSSQASIALSHDQSNNSLFNDPGIVNKVPLPLCTNSRDNWEQQFERSSVVTSTVSGCASSSMLGYSTMKTCTTNVMSVTTVPLQAEQTKAYNGGGITTGSSVTMPFAIGSMSSELYTSGPSLDNSTPTCSSSEVAQFVFPSAFPSIGDSLSTEICGEPICSHNDPPTCMSTNTDILSPNQEQSDLVNDLSMPPQSLTPVDDAECYDDPGIVFSIEGNKQPNQGTETKESPLQIDDDYTLETDPSLTAATIANNERTVSTAEGNVASESDLMFLIDCFPHLEPSYLKRILQKCSGNVEDTVSIALVSATIPERDFFSLTAPTCAADVTYTPEEACSSVRSASDHSLSSSAEHNITDCVNSLSALSLAHINSPNTPDGAEVSPLREDETDCSNDEEIARALQEQIEIQESKDNHASFSASESESNCQTPMDSFLHADNGVHTDDNLELKLTNSLARQLQSLFGPVDQYLPFQDQMRDDDLIILLSERAAKEIYKKWVDTLKAKKIGYQVQSELLMENEVAPALDNSKVTSKRMKKRHQTAPLELLTSGNTSVTRTLPFQQEQFSTIVERNGNSGYYTSKTQTSSTKFESKSNMTFRQQVKHLHCMFPQLEQNVINQTLVDNKFDMQSTVEVLTNLVGFDVPDDNNEPAATSLSRSVTAPSHMSNFGDHQAGATIKHSGKPKPVDEASFQTLDKQPSYNDLRAEAALHAKLRAENFQKAAHARSRKLYEVATYYARLGHLHTNKMKEANRRAAENIIHLQNEKGSNNLDLHGLHVDEALEALEEKLLAAKREKQPYLCVITGRGIHSRGKEARIKPAVCNLLKSHGYKYEEMNAGRLQVKIK